jgi:DNA helicase-2/ATP-dependent DNA helicase PcrA
MTATRVAVQVEQSAPEVDYSRFVQGANPEQTEAILHREGPLGVFAGAGSGKTRVLVSRVGALIASGVRPERIVSVTFSKKAADEMGERAAKMGIQGAVFATWHSLALRMLREDGTEWGTVWSVDDTDRAKLILKSDVLGYKGMGWNGADLGQVASFISFCKSQLWAANSSEAQAYAEKEFAKDSKKAIEAFKRYDVELADNQLLTFDDMLVFAYQWLSVEENRRRWASKWDYVLQDEAQDANPAQMKLASMLARDHRNYMIVGDPAQSIYGWRGSKPEYITTFASVWEGAKVVCMNRNYRCGSRIVDVANAVITKAAIKLPDDLIAEGGWEGNVSWRQCSDMDAEANFVAAEILERHNTDLTPLEHNTVLFRTNAQSRALEEALLARQIPYVVVGGVSFYERREVKDILAYLRVALGKGNQDENVRRCLNSPFRYLGAAFADKLSRSLVAFRGNVASAAYDACNATRVQARQRASVMEWVGILESVVAYENRLHDKESSEENAGTLIDALVEKTKYIEWLKRDQGEEGLESSHVANIKELARVATRFATATELLTFIDNTIAAAERQRKQKEQKGRVLLMSIHRSKGLEWPNVFVIGAVEGILPHGRGEPEEERRLFYVACTRAARRLYITSPKSIALKGGVKEVKVSQFVRDAGLGDELDYFTDLARERGEDEELCGIA